MLVKRLALSLLGTALMAAPALAQSQPQAQPSASPPAAGQPAPMTPGNVMTQMQPGQWRASDLEGLDIYNQNNEKIGDVSELIVDQSGKIQAVVVGVGGFLGIGERDVAIPFEQIRLVNEPRATATTAPTGTAMAPASPDAPATTGAVPADQTAAGAATRTGPDHGVLTMNMTKDQLRAMPEFRYAR